MKHISINQIAALIDQQILQLSTQENIYIGLSGGRSLDGLYPILLEIIPTFSKDIQQKLIFGLVDERILPDDNEERNSYSIYQKFYSHLLNKNIITPIQIKNIDISSDYIANTYSQDIPRIDIAFFGVGEDGHIASLFPFHPLLQSEIHGFGEIFDAPKVPPHRITLLPKFLLTISYVYAFFVGPSKQDAYNKFLSTSDIDSLPVNLLKQKMEVFVVKDELTSFKKTLS